MTAIFRFLQNPLVESEPRKFAVDEAVGRRQIRNSRSGSADPRRRTAVRATRRRRSVPPPEVLLDARSCPGHCSVWFAAAHRLRLEEIRESVMTTFCLVRVSSSRMRAGVTGRDFGKSPAVEFSNKRPDRGRRPLERMQHAVDRRIRHRQLTVREQFACNSQQEGIIRKPQPEIWQCRESRCKVGKCAGP